jgi:hypothetical protein
MSCSLAFFRWDFSNKNGDYTRFQWEISPRKIGISSKTEDFTRIVCQWKMFQNEDFTTAKNSCGLI